ncbi:putative L,D-transpeptidase YciB precursor [Clostridium vincentii]|uniref:Putative L,D-transpeptidase YciB n=2 Tax=Clostridium vincentii TaxID=52704 RepID=A0A2T0BCG4_9CLOT|nr:putative L,D-transpeptidase YciB precursor [Clostridium vincentii]
MAKRAQLTFGKRGSQNNNNKLYLSILLIILMLGSLVFYEYYTYKILVRDFSSSFDENEFSSANNILLTDGSFNPFKVIYLKDDLSAYFSTKITNLSIELNDGNINEVSAFNIIEEIKRYDIPITIPEELASGNSYESAIDLFDLGKYIQAYKIFSTVKSTDLNYASSIEYTRECKKNITLNIINESTQLCTNKEFDKALALLDSVNLIVGESTDIVSKVEEVKKYYSDSLTSNNDSAADVSSSLAIITTSNINTLSLESITSYLIQVDISNQKTNIFKGKLNKWNLIKSFTCSTGIDSEKTPSGVYTIKEKGSWFFSDTYNQGGKYWVQFYGDYLFHSLPYDEEKTTVVDYTLGKPASHGCIRLAESDSKWIYDNISKGSKVVIQ